MSCALPKLSLVVWEARLTGPAKYIFVAVPNERGRYVRTDVCVAFVGCEYCGVTVGEPCHNRGDWTRYHSMTHVSRREDYNLRRKQGEFSGAVMDVARFHSEDEPEK